MVQLGIPSFLLKKKKDSATCFKVQTRTSKRASYNCQCICRVITIENICNDKVLGFIKVKYWKNWGLFIKRIRNNNKKKLERNKLAFERGIDHRVGRNGSDLQI